MTATNKRIKPEKRPPATKNKTVKPSPPVEEKILKVIINVHPGTKVEISQWEIEKTEDADPERVDVQTSDLCYSTILDPLEPKVETWGVTKTGQLSKSPLTTSGLPFVRELAVH